MSAYTNGLAFWKHFEEKQGAIINCLKAEQYEELNELIQELDEEVMEISGAHFFVESFYDSFEMTLTQVQIRQRNICVRCFVTLHLRV